MWRRWMAARLEGEEIENLRLIRHDRQGLRGMARTFVAGAGGQPPLQLSVAIAGGASVVKRGNPESWLLSGHGGWPELHLRAIEAAYGATPFFRYLYPDIRTALSSAVEGSRFADLTMVLHKACSSFIDAENLIPELRKLREENPHRFRTLAEEYRLPDRLEPGGEEKRGMDYAEMAFIDVIFRNGPQSIFSLLPLPAESGY